VARESEESVDVNVKIFGRPPCPLISVKFEYLKEPNDLLSQLTEFIYKHAKTIDFSNEPPDYWLAIFKAVLASQSYEHQVFKTNLDELIKDNIKELGFDPRITGPPQHVLN
jgi:hypothetical protein